MSRRTTGTKIQPARTGEAKQASAQAPIAGANTLEPAIPTDQQKLELTVHLAEYAALRKEIELRLGWQTIAVSVSLPFFAGILVAAVGAMGKDNGRLWVEQYPIVLAATTVGASILGLLVCNQDLMVFRLGGYIQSELSGKVKAIVGADAFGWETFHPTQEKGVPILLSVTVHALLFIAAVIPLGAFVACYVSVGLHPGAYDYHRPTISHWVFIGFAVLTFLMFSLALFGSYRVAKHWRLKAKQPVG